MTALGTAVNVKAGISTFEFESTPNAFSARKMALVAEETPKAKSLPTYSLIAFSRILTKLLESLN